MNIVFNIYEENWNYSNYTISAFLILFDICRNILSFNEIILSSSPTKIQSSL